MSSKFKETFKPFMADIDALIALKFPGPVQTAILSMSSISISDSFKNLEIKKKAYHCYYHIFQKT